MQDDDVPSFQHRLKQLQASFLATSTRISSEVLASRMQCGLPGFGPALVAASAFLQQLLWTAVWLQSMAASSCQSRGKRGKKSGPQVMPYLVGNSLIVLLSAATSDLYML